MRIVGLTGGIASGKSTVSNLFRSNGLPIVDADLVARDVVRKGSGGWKKVVKAFGDDILLENGEIDRAHLGQIVFSDPEKRQLLNRLLAPYISSGIFWEILKLWIKGSKVIILDIPLLFEAKMDRWTAPIIVVWVDPETQLQRLMARDGISEEQATNRINAQTSLDWKRSKADIVIDNSGTMDETKLQFEEVLSQVSQPLAWKEFAFSRDGLFWILASVTVGVLAVQKNLSCM
ncbi:dephospho-CoA kinase [Typha latifolia]|uniref:dephospho-CoA kinase n=1 Tax=Typha latifolia TaxID=4733 RepID=UPI003C2FFE79